MRRRAAITTVIALIVGVLALTSGVASAAPAITSISPGGGLNTANAQVTINGTGFEAGSTVSFVEKHPISGAVETTVPATNVVITGTNKITATLPTLGQAPSNPSTTPPATADVSWFVRVTSGGDDDDSTEFELLGETPSLTSVSPGDVAQDSTVTITLRGSNFARRAAISVNQPGFPQDPITFSNPTWQSLDRYTVQITVPDDYPVGRRDVTIRNTDGEQATCAGCLNITPKTATKVPNVTDIDPGVASNGDANGSFPVEITGTNFNETTSTVEAALVGHCASAGCPMAGRTIPVTVTKITPGATPFDDDTIEGTVDLVLEAPGPYSARVTNKGAPGVGTGALANAFEVLANPPTISKPTSSFPVVMRAGQSVNFTIEGNNFAEGDTVVIPDTTIQQVQVSSRTKLVVTAVPKKDANTARRDLTVRHTNGAQAVCSNCVQINADLTAVERYIKATYQLFLKRDATAADLNRWRSPVSRGERDRLTQSLATSDEFAGVQIDQLYRTILGRPADSGGRAYWLEQVRNGTRLDQIASFFYGGEEFFKSVGSTNRKYVDALYRMILRRSGDESGRNYWTGELNANRLTRSQVAGGFYDGIESRRQRVTAQYRLVLNRDPDTAGRDYWADQIRTLGDIVLAAFLAASDEYYRKVTS